MSSVLTYTKPLNLCSPDLHHVVIILLPERPTAPIILAEAVDEYQTFNLSINPPVKGVFCVTQYNVTLADNIGNVYSGKVNVSNPQLNITVDVKDVVGNVTLDMCRYRYSFQVVATNGKESTPPTAPVIDFSGTLHIIEGISLLFLWSKYYLLNLLKQL